MKKFEETKKTTFETGTTNQTTEENYIYAFEARWLANKLYPKLYTKQIFEKIKECATNGKHCVRFDDSHMYGYLYEELKSRGFKIEIDTSDDKHPFFIVSW